VASVPPRDKDLDEVHQAYVTMAAAGLVTEVQRAVFVSACRRFVEEDGVDAVILGGTDLALSFDAQTSDFPLVDCAAIHVDLIVRRAIGSHAELAD
jgi:aspartate racemase